MVFRIIGFGLLIIIGLPLAIAFPPLAVVAAGVWFLSCRGRSRQAAAMPGPMATGGEWHPSSGWQPPTQVNHTQLTFNPRPERPRRTGFGGVLIVLASVVVFMSVLGMVARQAPFILVPLLLLGTMLALKMIGKRVSRRGEPMLGPRPATTYASSPTPAPAPDTRAMLSLSDAEFEQRVADLLRSFGYHSIQHVGQPGRQGIDIIARDQHGHLFLVLCQQYAPGNRAGSVDMQDLVDAVIREQAAGGIFVTTATFTQAAINLAQYSRVPIVLYDGAALDRLAARPSWRWSAA